MLLLHCQSQWFANRLLWLNRNLNFRNVKKVIWQVNRINPGNDFNSITLHQLYAFLPWRLDSSAFKTIFLQTYFYIMGIHFHLWRWPWLVHMNWFIWIKSKIIYDFMFTRNALGFYWFTCYHKHEMLREKDAYTLSLKELATNVWNLHLRASL